MIVKRFYLLLIMIVGLSVSVDAQTSNVRICTEQEIPSAQRKLYLKAAENFLGFYYGGILFTLNDNMVQESFIQRNMVKDSRRYKPEFLLNPSGQEQFLSPEQYLQELTKEYLSYTTEDLEINVSDVTFDNTFRATNNIDCLVTAHYTLSLKKEDKTLFSRQCTAQCYWPQSRMVDQIALLQVEPVKDIVAYRLGIEAIQADNQSINASYDMQDETEAVPVGQDSPANPVFHPYERSSKPNTIHGHEYVDLGLSVKWATCNIGANKPEEMGQQYGWGESMPHDPDEKLNKKKKKSRTYKKKIPHDISGNLVYDTARLKWQGSWRMPTTREMQELIDKCKWEWVTVNNVQGYKVTGPNGNHLFLPTEYFNMFIEDFHFSIYWSATSTINNKSADALSIISSKKNDGKVIAEKHLNASPYRYASCYIRPVTD